MKPSQNEIGSLSIYLDDPVYLPGVPCIGLSRVNRHILNSLPVDTPCVMNGAFRNFKSIDKNLNKNVLVIRSFNQLLSKIFSKLKIKLKERIVCFNMFDLLRMRKVYFKESYLFVPVGVSFISILRANQIAKDFQMKLGFFLVDDLLENLKFAKQNELIVQNAIKILATANHLFCATEGLRKKYLAINPNVICLFMPYRPLLPSVTEISSRSMEIIFLGSPSHFYLDGIKQLTQAIHLSSYDIKLRFTFGEEIVKSIFNSSGIQYTVKPFLTEKDLAAALQNSLCAFVPYSFSSKFYQMVTTSFPSKLYEYLAYAKRILVVAPAYSTAANLFNTNCLSAFVDTEEPQSITKVLSEFVEHRADYSHQYHRVLEQFSYEMFYSKLLKEINNG